MGSAALWNIHQQESYTNFWSDNQSLKRMPAHEEKKSRDINLYRDFFMPNTFGRMLDYKIVPRVRTNKDGQFVKEKLNEVIQSSLAKSIIDSKNGENPFHHNLKNNLVEGFIKKFIKTLKIVKIANGAFQIDLQFIPKENRNFNFNKLLNSNNLINHHQKGNLSDFLEEKEKTLVEIISENNIPSDGDTYQYMGGVVSIWIKVLDMNYDFANPIPDVSKNAIKGFVRYRRYFRLNRLPDIDFSLDKETFKMDYVHFKRQRGFLQPFMTVDIEKEFNLENISPQLTNLNIGFGDLIPSNFYRKGFIPNLIQKNEKSINTGVMKFNGEMNKVGYVAELTKLNWDFSEGKFENKSDLKVKLSKAVDNAGELKTKIKDHLLTKYGHYIINSFQLERFHKEVRNQ